MFVSQALVYVIRPQTGGAVRLPTFPAWAVGRLEDSVRPTAATWWGSIRTW